MPHNINLREFRNNLNRLLIAIEARCGDEIEPSDLAELIGRVIPCESASVRALNELCECLSIGLRHGIGLNLGAGNTKRSIEDTINGFEADARELRLESLAELSAIDQEIGWYDDNEKPST